MQDYKNVLNKILSAIEIELHLWRILVLSPYAKGDKLKGNLVRILKYNSKAVPATVSLVF